MGIPIKKGGAIILKTDDTIEEDLHEYVPDFSTPEWRARLMDWAVEQEWWIAFIVWVKDGYTGHPTNDTAGLYAYLWRHLASLLYEYHRKGK